MQQPPRQPGGLLGLVAAIPQLIEGIKQAKQQAQLQKMLAGAQEVSIFQQQAAADPDGKSTWKNPTWLAALTKTAKNSDYPLPFKQGEEGGMPGAGVAPTALGTPGGMTGGNVFQTNTRSPGASPAGGAGVGAASPSQVSDPRLTMINPGKANLATPTALPQIGAQTARQTGPQLDVNAFTGKDPVRDFIQKNLPNIEASPPEQRANLIETATGQKLTPEQSKQVESIPYELPPNAQVKREGQVNTLINQQLKQAASTGTSTSLIAAVRYASGQVERIYGNTPEGEEKAQEAIAALTDQALNSMTPAEIAKIAEQKATTGLKDTQAQVMRETAQPRIELYQAQADEARQRGHALQENADTQKALIGAKYMNAQAAVKNAYSRAATIESTNAEKWASAHYYGSRAQDIVAQGNERATRDALNAVRAAKSSADNGIRNMQTQIAGIQKTMLAGGVGMDPGTKAKVQRSVDGLNAQLQVLQSRSSEYDSTISTLTNKLAPGANLGAAPQQSGINISGAPNDMRPGTVEYYQTLNPDQQKVYLNNKNVPEDVRMYLAGLSGAQ